MMFLKLLNLKSVITTGIIILVLLSLFGLNECNKRSKHRLAFKKNQQVLEVREKRITTKSKALKDYKEEINIETYRQKASETTKKDLTKEEKEELDMLRKKVLNKLRSLY